MEALLDLIVDPFRFPFMVRAFAAAIFVGIVCSVIGSFVVVRGMAFIGDALAHAILPGVAIAFLVSRSQSALFVGAIVAGVVTAVGIGWLTRRTHLKEDTVIGVLFAGMFALGIALISTIRSYTVDLAHILFGNVLGVSTTDLWLTAIMALAVLSILFFFFKELLLVSFDRVHAAVLGLPTAALDYLLLVLLAFTIVVSLQTVGVALVVAMLVTPAAAASLLTRNFRRMMLVAALIGVTGAVLGLYASFYWNIASGAAIVLTVTLIFFCVFLLAPQRGFLWRRWRKPKTMPGEEEKRPAGASLLPR